MLNVLNSVALALDYRLNFLSRAINKSGEPIELGNSCVNRRVNNVSLTRQHGFKVKGGQLPLVFFGVNFPREAEKISVVGNVFVIESSKSRGVPNN